MINNTIMIARATALRAASVRSLAAHAANPTGFKPAIARDKSALYAALRFPDDTKNVLS